MVKVLEVEEAKENKLLEKIQKAIDENPEADVYFLAEMILDNLERAELVYLIAEEIKHRKRQNVREVEHKIFQKFFEKGSENEVKIGTAKELQELFKAHFALGDGQEAVFGKATVEEHEQRVVMLGKDIAGLERTKQLHLEAIRIIEEAGVTCLEEIK